MTLKKLFLLIVPLIAVIQLNCGSNADKRIVIWTNLRPVEREFLQEKLNEFQKRYPQYEFQQLFYQPEELRTNFIISALAGKGPALIHSPSDNIGPMSELEVIKPLEDYFNQAFLDSFASQPVQANTWFNGHLYQIADRVGNHLCLVYNKDIIEEPPKTISELIQIGERIAKDDDGDGNPERYVLAWNFIEPFFFVPFIGGYGGWIFDDNGDPNLNTEAVSNAAQLVYKLANKYEIIPKECDYETANALFLDGHSAMIINGPWSWGTYIKNGMNIGISRIPKIDESGQWPQPLVSPRGYMVNANLEGEKLNIIIELIHYLTTPSIQLQYARQFNVIPSRKTIWKDSVLQQNQLFTAALDQMSVGRAMPVVTELRWIWDAMRPAYQGIFTGQYKPEEAAREMQRLAEKLIRENRG
ncbi:MAG: extracellular solute-binding protein [Aliifodinibius sp.]|nr:extracellular solute-binding protein [Fodinibius sp.]